MRSPYEILGILKTATPDEIKKAFRTRAQSSHPDLNPGDKKAEERFKELSLANEILSDPEKRKRFDAGEIDGLGADIPRPSFYKDYADQPGENHYYQNNAGFADFGDVGGLFEQMRTRQNERARNAHGADIHYEVTVNFLDAINGSTKSLTLANAGTLELKIPPGTSDETVIRVRGKGQPAAGTGRPGDALITIFVKPHRIFSRIDNDIYLELPITIQEAVLGAKIKVPTVLGFIMLTIPAGSTTGAKLRIKAKGVAGHLETGDEIVTLKIMIPTKIDPELSAFLVGWKPAETFEPRKDLNR